MRSKRKNCVLLWIAMNYQFFLFCYWSSSSVSNLVLNLEFYSNLCKAVGALQSGSLILSQKKSLRKVTVTLKWNIKRKSSGLFFFLSLFWRHKKNTIQHLNVQWAGLSTHWWTLHRALLIRTNVTPPRSDGITLWRTFSSCQRWSITLLTYTCTTHGLDGFTPASFCQAD